MRIWIAIGLLLLIAPLAARGGVHEEARKHFDLGAQLVARHEFQAAIEEFENSYRLSPLPEILFDIALSQRALGRYSEAIGSMRRYLDESLASAHGLSDGRKSEAQALLAELDAKRATLEIHAPAGTELTVDGRRVGPAPASLKLDPGAHRIDAAAAGFQPARADVVLASSRVETLELALEPASIEGARVVSPPRPEPPPRAIQAPRPRQHTEVTAPPERSPAPYLATARGRVVLGLGVSALALFAVAAATGGTVLSERDRYRASCDQICDDDLYAQARRIAISTDVLFAVGGAAAITSLVLLIARPPHRVARALPTVTARGLAWQGVF